MDTLPPPLVLVHGFTQTSVSWRPVCEHLPADLEVHAVDAPGHGTAGAVHTDLHGAAERVGLSIDPDRPACVVGYSMGGRIALRLAIDHPRFVAGLVLVGATAGIDDGGERHARRDADDHLARRIEAYGVAPFIDDWLGQALFAGLEVASDDFVDRLANTPEGLASALRQMGTGTMDPPWWDELARIAVPTLVVWGQRDAKFAALGERLAASIGPNATTAEIADAGHAAHLEQPAAFAAVVASFVRSLTAGPTGQS